jgi:hypothetical protein
MAGKDAEFGHDVGSESDGDMDVILPSSSHW